MATLDGHPRESQPKTPLVLVPYAAGSVAVGAVDPGDPFHDGRSAFGSVGLDLRRKVGGGFALDATVNPDFGQVEVDPAVVNLTDFETFFPEKRPFFVEGAQIFDNFGRNGAEQLLRLQCAASRTCSTRGGSGAPRRARRRRRYVDVPLDDDDPRRGQGHREERGRLERRCPRGRHRRARSAPLGGWRHASGRQPVEPLTNYFVARANQRPRASAGYGVLLTP